MDGSGYGDGVHPVPPTFTLENYTCPYTAEEALAASEVPVGCIFVRDSKAIARARNCTNELRDVSLHTPPDIPLADA